MATASVRKFDRLEARVAHDQKALLQRAAALEGQTLTEFVVSSAVQRAVRAIHEHEVIALSARDGRAFVEALMSPPAPNEQLQRAVARYRRVTAAD